MKKSGRLISVIELKEKYREVIKKLQYYDGSKAIIEVKMNYQRKGGKRYWRPEVGPESDFFQCLTDDAVEQLEDEIVEMIRNKMIKIVNEMLKDEWQVKQETEQRRRL